MRIPPGIDFELRAALEDLQNQIIRLGSRDMQGASLSNLSRGRSPLSAALQGDVSKLQEKVQELEYRLAKLEGA